MINSPTILMCPPDFYGIEYEINPWMNQERQADHALAVRQWEALVDILKSLDVHIELVPPQRGLPDLVFTANAGVVQGQQAILSRFRHEQRQGEEQHFARTFQSLSFDVLRLSTDRYFEGAGDALFLGETLFGGYRIRSTAQSLHEVGQLLDRPVIPLELVDTRFYHLDTCFCPVNQHLAIWFPGAFDEYGQTVIQSRIPNLIELTEEEATAFAANAVVVGHSVVTNSGCPLLGKALRSEGFNAIETPLSEFVKAGGSAKCLTLRLDGEEAAA